MGKKFLDVLLKTFHVLLQAFSQDEKLFIAHYQTWIELELLDGQKWFLHLMSSDWWEKTSYRFWCMIENHGLMAFIAIPAILNRFCIWIWSNTYRKISLDFDLETFWGAGGEMILSLKYFVISYFVVQSFFCYSGISSTLRYVVHVVLVPFWIQESSSREDKAAAASLILVSKLMSGSKTCYARFTHSENMSNYGCVED